jgi:hypothetical protein
VSLGYELIVTNDGAEHVESFGDLSALLSREYALVQEWRAAGWRHDGPAHEHPKPAGSLVGGFRCPGGDGSWTMPFYDVVAQHERDNGVAARLAGR